MYIVVLLHTYIGSSIVNSTAAGKPLVTERMLICRDVVTKIICTRTGSA